MRERGRERASDRERRRHGERERKGEGFFEGCIFKMLLSFAGFLQTNNAKHKTQTGDASLEK